jgi:hypothetical protein
MSERNPDELGALWEKSGAKGPYLTGEINGVKVVCFRNTKAHDNPKAPAWRVLKSKPQGERESLPARESAAPVTDDSIPF